MDLPPKPKRSPDDLAEVERALSVLHGRHPEHERVRREDVERRTARRLELEAQSRTAARAELVRRAKIAGVGIVVLLAVAVLGLSFRREAARRARVEQAGDPFRAAGYVVVESSGGAAPGRLEATAEPGCFVAVATKPGALEITRGGGGAPIAGPSPVAFCTCESEKITVSSASPDAEGGIVLLRVDAATVGGSRAARYLPFTPGVIASTDDACREASFDAWLDAKHGPRTRADASRWLGADPRRAVLRAVKLEPVAMIARDQPIVVVDAPRESCLVVVASAADALTLRARGGATPIHGAKGAFAHCAEKEAAFVVQREGEGEVTVLAGPAAALGGAFGLGEIAVEAGLGVTDVFVPAADRAWDAKQALVGSAVPEALVTTTAAPEVAQSADGRIVAVSFGTPGALTPEPATDVFSYCEPPLDDRRPHALCIFSGPQRWRPKSGEAVGGLARAKLPFWLLVMDGVSEPVALEAESHLLAFARRLRRQGFEPTTLEAMTELASGVEVLGRSGEDAVVAVGVAPLPPFVFPYSDGPAWTIGGEPRVVPLKTLEKVTLSTTVKPLPPKDKRRTVVFRRQAK